MDIDVLVIMLKFLSLYVHVIAFNYQNHYLQVHKFKYFQRYIEVLYTCVINPVVGTPSVVIGTIIFNNSGSTVKKLSFDYNLNLENTYKC